MLFMRNIQKRKNKESRIRMLNENIHNSELFVLMKASNPLLDSEMEMWLNGRLLEM